MKAILLPKGEAARKMRICIVLAVLLLLGGALLALKGNDAVTLAAEQKDGILTAEQIQVSFEKVGGRLMESLVQEEQRVHKGDILMRLDSKDTDLEIEKCKSEIARLDAQIGRTEGAILIGFDKTDTKEQQKYRDIEQQKLLLDSAKVDLQDKERTYNRMKSLFETGAVARAELDASDAALDIARSSAAQQARQLDRMLEGVGAAGKNKVYATGTADQLTLAEIDQERRDLENQKFGVKELIYQKESLLVQLKELELQKERLTLVAPADGKIISVIPKVGEMVVAGAPVILLETDQLYYDFYLDEYQAVHLSPGSKVTGKSVALQGSVSGVVRFITAAPGFAALKMSREKGQADLAAFQVRVYVEPMEKLLPGMTIKVSKNEFTP